jgi:hypothetical protein
VKKDLKNLQNIEKNKKQEKEINMTFQKKTIQKTPTIPKKEQPEMTALERKLESNKGKKGHDKYGVPLPPSEPWKQARTLEIPAHWKNKHYVYRWVDTLRPGNVRKKQSEWWEIDQELTDSMLGLVDNNRRVGDKTSLDSTTISPMCGMVLMRMPKTWKKKREDGLEARTAASRVNAEKLIQIDEKGKETGQEAPTYGKVKEEAQVAVSIPE